MAGPYKVDILATARRELAKLPAVARRRIGRALDGLQRQPRPTGAKLLVGSGGERIWRIRVGDYRVLYHIQEDRLVVLVIRIGHRREAYRSR